MKPWQMALTKKRYGDRVRIKTFGGVRVRTYTEDDGSYPGCVYEVEGSFRPGVWARALRRLLRVEAD